MKDIQLLDKTRQIEKLLRDNRKAKVSFVDICAILSDVLSSNTLVLSRKGKVLGKGQIKNVPELKEYLAVDTGSFINETFNNRLLSVLSTQENVNLLTLGFTEDPADRCSAMVTPVFIGGDRLGTLMLYREDNMYDISEIILAEYGSTVVGLEMVRALAEEHAEEQRKERVVEGAMDALSQSELRAVKHIVEELDGYEGVLVASKIADRVGITRSVIVNALRKLESAGVIISRSSGMKGTYIRIVNEYLFDALESREIEG